jgi:hypothetical protein
MIGMQDADGLDSVAYTIKQVIYGGHGVNTYLPWGCAMAPDK